MKFKEAGMNIVFRISLSIVLIVTAACASQETYRDTKMDLGSIYTVAIMPLMNLSRDQTASERVRDVLQTMLLATGNVYVIPPGEVAKQYGMAGVVYPSTPTIDESIKLGKMLKVDAVITGVVREYGEVRSGSASANVISVSVQLTEIQTGKVVSSVASTRGGIGFMERMFGGGGEPMNDITEKSIKDVISELLK
jgi:hypothetical protein